MYLPYALFCEGSSDFDYLEVLIPRLIDDLVSNRGRRMVDVPTVPTFRLRQSGRSVQAVAEEACDKKEAFLLVFIHADTAGTGRTRTLDSRSAAYCRTMREICCFDPHRCILVRPRHEMEAWALADPEAMRDALGYRGRLGELGLPMNAREAERLPNPKKTLRAALGRLRGRRRRDETTVLPAIAQRQSIDALRRARSFAEFEKGLTTALGHVGAI